MIPRQMTPFLIYSLSSVCWYISFLHFILRPSKFNSKESPLCIMLWNVSYTLTYKDDISKPVNIYIFFLRTIGQLLVCNMVCSQFDTNLALIPLTNTWSENNGASFSLKILYESLNTTTVLIIITANIFIVIAAKNSSGKNIYLMKMIRGIFRTHQTSKMERFAIITNAFSR